MKRSSSWRSALRRTGILLAAWTASAAPGAASAAVLPVDTILDAHDETPGDGICHANALVNCSYRAALEEANALPGADQIRFDIPGAPPHVIRPSTDGAVFPQILDSVVIDGSSEPDAQDNSLALGYDAVHSVVLENDGLVGPGVHILADDVTVRGLLIRGFDTGIRIEEGPATTLPDFTIVPGARPSRVQLYGNRVEGNNAVGLFVLAGLAGGPDEARIGSASPRDRNVFFDNTSDAEVILDLVDSFFENNYVGTLDGTTAAGAQATSVQILGNDNRVVSNRLIGHSDVGLDVRGLRNRAVSNFISADPTGGLAFFNSIGVDVRGGGQHQIGPANVISGNGTGAQLRFGVSGVRVIGNTIGLAEDGVSLLPNSGVGVDILDSDGNWIGGDASEGNLIARNFSGGVIVRGTSMGNRVLSNRLYRNSDGSPFFKDLDLGGDAVTPNDPPVEQDADLGPNGLQNFPILNMVSRFQGSTTLTGVLDSRPNRTYRVQFFSNASFCLPSGQFFIGETQVMTDASGHTEFQAPFQVTSLGTQYTATATDLVTGDTSEFSPCFTGPGLEGADVRLDKSADASVVQPGDLVVWTVRVRNFGPGDVTFLDVEDVIPDGVALGGWTESQGSYDPQTGIWDVGTLPGPALNDPAVPVATLEIQTFVTANEGTITNDARIASALPLDVDLADNADSVSIEVLTGADVELGHSVSPVAAGLGESFDFQLSVVNNGPEDASGVLVSGLLPPELGTPTANPPDDFSFDASSRRWSWAVGDLAKDAADALTLTAPVVAQPADPTLPLSHTASARVGSPADEIPFNNLRTVQFGIGGAADLRIVSITSARVQVGEVPVIEFRILVGNDGPDAVDEYFLEVAADDFSALGVVDPGVPNELCSESSPGAEVVVCHVTHPFQPGETAEFAVHALLEEGPPPGTPSIAASVDSFDAYDPDPNNNFKIGFTGFTCFIATAAWGSPLEPHVQALRDFRDAHLLTNAPGRAFVELYYALSPPLAEAIAARPALRAATRVALTPVVSAVLHPTAAAALGLLTAIGLLALRHRVRGRR